MTPTNLPRRPEWLTDELRRLHAEERTTRQGLAQLEGYKAAHGHDTEPEVLLAIHEAREHLDQLEQRRSVLIHGWDTLCRQAQHVHT